jgi:dihydrofolate reductase
MRARRARFDDLGAVVAGAYAAAHRSTASEGRSLVHPTVDGATCLRHIRIGQEVRRAGDEFSTRRPSKPRAAVVAVQEQHVTFETKETTMRELLVDFITSVDGYASAEGWPGWWGLQGPEYLAWLGEQPEVTYLMGANTYRLMSGFAAGEPPAGQDEFAADEEESVDVLTRASKVVFSASLEEPLAWANSTLVRGDAVEAVRAMKEGGSGLLGTLGSLSLCRSLLRAGLVDRFRVVLFPVITGATGAERIYDGYPDVALEMINSRTFDRSIQLVEYRPRVLERPPLASMTG